MKTHQILSELQEKYPGKIIKLLPENNPTEIICEVTSTREKSFTIAIIETSVPHYHKKATEIYKVIRGSLSVHLDEQVISLQVGESCEIKPGIFIGLKAKMYGYHVFQLRPGRKMTTLLLQIDHILHG